MAPSPPAPTSAPTGGIQVVRRAAAVLRTIGEQRGGLRLAELAAHVDLPKTTIHRIVSALADERLLRIDPSGRIWIGATITALARVGSSDLADQLRPVLVDLHRRVDETVDISVLDGTGVRFVDQIPSRHRLRAVSTVGASFPLHCSANGKALLAALAPAQVEDLVPRRLEAFTPNTIVDRAQLIGELDRIRSEGVAYDREEHTMGISAVGVAVGHVHGPLAAISVPTPAERFEVVADRLRMEVLTAKRDAEALLDA